jgi:hypothetical protein
VLQVASSIFCNWSISQASPLRRSMASPSLWGACLTIQVPVTFRAFEYKFLARNSEGQLWVEGGPVRCIELAALLLHHRIWAAEQALHPSLRSLPPPPAGDILIEQEDIFQLAAPIPG